MKTYANFTKFTPARGIVTAALIAACLAALSSASAAQLCAPVATNVVAWIQQDTPGGPRYVCYKAASGTPTLAGQLSEPQPTSAADNRPRPTCVWTSYGWMC
jgi:hypothetical protein